MCVIVYCLCEECHLGYPSHTLFCENFRPPYQFCPSSTRFNFVIIAPEQCLLFPEHIQMETTGVQVVNFHDNNGQVVSQRRCEGFVQTGAIADYLANQQQQQQQPRSPQQSASLHRPTPHAESTFQTWGATGSGYAVAAPRHTPTPPTVEPYFTPSSPIPEAEEEAEASATAEFADQHQQVDEALMTYRTSTQSIPSRGRAMERIDTVHSSASDTASGSVSRPGSQLAARNRRSSSVPAEPTEGAQGTSSATTSRLNPALPPFYPKKQPGTPSSKKSSPVKTGSSKKKNKKGKQPATMETPVKESATPIETPAREPATEQEVPGSAVAPMTQSTMPSSPALSVAANTTTTVASSDTRSPSVRRPTVIEASEFPSLEAAEPPQMASTDRPAVRSWASIVGPRKQQQKPLPAQRKQQKPPQQQLNKQASGQSNNGSPSADQSDNQGSAVITKPARSYSAALSSGSNVPAKKPVKAATKEDWPAPPPSWGKRPSTEGGK
ncbi:hypothetical protein PG985_012902 [Apiospora marii]|uniref:uncharacterized protein n=1 Tax=Apiospora marii TaxID=335849 RepID=UPI003131433E